MTQNKSNSFTNTLSYNRYDTRSGYGVHNKLDMLSLCGESIWWNFDVVVGGPRLALLSQFWNSSVCYCSDEVRNRAQEVWDWHHRFGINAGVHDDRWIHATAPFRKKNLPIARHCGLWTRLFPWPDPKGVAQAVSTFPKHQRERDKYCSASRSAASLVEDTRCRGDIRTYVVNVANCITRSSNINLEHETQIQIRKGTVRSWCQRTMRETVPCRQL